MRKLRDIRDEEALDLFASLFEPAQAIYNDQKVRESFKTRNAPHIAKALAEAQPEAVKQIMATLDGVEADDEYHYSAMMLVIRVAEILTDKELMAFFS